MHEDLISKRELLTTYGISYGTLYRWRRAGLIPDDWFIRKSTETGQETFFPRELMVERVNYIFLEKEGMSLEEISQRMNSEAKESMTLIIETKYGEQKIRMDQIVNISITCDGKLLGIDEIVNILKNTNT